jgi:cystathionine gamma-synthase
LKPPLSAETLAAQALGEIDPESGALVPPIHPSTTYEFGPDGTYRSGRAYTRADNPTYDHAERLLATLEGGAGCVLFASGNAAATAVFQSLLPGDHVLVARVLYWARLHRPRDGEGLCLRRGVRPCRVAGLKNAS